MNRIIEAMQKSPALLLLTSTLLFAQGETPFAATLARVAGPADSMAAGDLDRDGADDLVVALNGNVIVRWGGGPRDSITPMPGVFSIQAVADFTNDGWPDVAILRNDSVRGIQALILPNRGGDSGFQAGIVVPLETCVIRLTGDFNRDGLTDVACANQRQAFYYGTGGGALTAGPAGPNTTTKDRPAFAAGDFNRDGFIDLVSLNEDSSAVQFWWGEAALRLRRGLTVALPKKALCAAVSDVNRDGQPEIYSIPAGYPGATVTQITKITTSSFDLRPLFAADGIFGEGCLVADFNGDAQPDFLASSYTVAYVSSRAGYYPSTTRLPLPLGPMNAVTGDFDGDGKLDLAIGGDRGRTPYPVSIYLNGLAISGVRLLPPALPIAPDQPLRVTVELTSPVASITPRGQFDLVSTTDGKLLARAAVLPVTPPVRLAGNSGPWIVGRAVIPLTLANGRYTLRATYGGDANFNPGPSRELTLAVTKGRFLFTRNDDEPVPENTAFSLEVRSGVNATGEVKLEADGRLVSAASLRDGRVTFFVAPQAAGVRRLTLIYAGDATWEPIRQEMELRVARTWRLASAATGQPGLSPDSLAAGYGSALADFAASSVGALELAGTSLRILDSRGQSIDVPLLYASPTQVNFYVPAWVSPGAARAILTRHNSDTVLAAFNVESIAPGLFTAPGGVAPAALVVRAGSTDYAFSCAGGLCRPKPIAVRTGETVVVSFFGTGLRGARPESVVVDAGGVSMPVLYCGPQAEVAGLYQINALVPEALRGRGEVTVRVTAGRVESNVVRLSFE